MPINEQGLEERSTITSAGKVAVCQCGGQKNFHCVMVRIANGMRSIKIRLALPLWY